jgi:ABC-2 type transport system ATP-binding protein
VLVSSHLLSEMQLLADDVVIIAGGRLVTMGPVERIVAGAAQGAQVRVRTPEPDNLIAELGVVALVRRADDGALLITGVEAPAVGAAALRASVELHELVAERPDLERVFLELTAGKAGIR